MHSKTLHENASRPKNRIVNGSRETRPLFVSPSRFGGSAEVCLRERVARKLLAGVLPLGDLAAVNAEIRSGRFALRHKTIDRPRELESNPNGSLNTAEVCAFTRQVHVPYVYSLSQQHFFFRRDQHYVRQEVARGRVAELFAWNGEPILQSEAYLFTLLQQNTKKKNRDIHAISTS